MSSTLETRSIGSSSTRESPGAQSSQPEVTFGVEFEYILSFCREDLASNGGPDEGALETVREALSGLLHTQCSICDLEVSFRLPLRIPSPISADMRNAYDKWQVVGEVIHSPVEDRMAINYNSYHTSYEYYFVGIEVVSRILQADRFIDVTDHLANHVHRISWAEEVKAVVQHLQQTFGERFSSQERKLNYLHSVPGAGLHVHVGNGENGLGLDTVKNIMSFNAAFERQIDSVHASHRIGVTDQPTRPLADATGYSQSSCNNDRNVHNLGVIGGIQTRTYYRRLAEGGAPFSYTFPGKEYPSIRYGKGLVEKAAERDDIFAYLELIREAENLYDVCDMCPYQDKRSATNLRELRAANEDSDAKNTIEFRQHRSTLQSAAIIPWLTFVVALVNYCDSNNVAALQAVFQDHVQKPDLTFPDVCRLIGCNQKTIQFYEDQLSAKYSRNLRAKEKKRAGTAAYRGDPLGSLALENIRRERAETNPKNAARRIEEKFLLGGYGQFSRSFIDESLGSTISVTYRQRQQITIGYKPPMRGQAHEREQLEPYNSAAEDSDGYATSEPGSEGSDLDESEEVRGWRVEASNMDRLATPGVNITGTFEPLYQSSFSVGPSMSRRSRRSISPSSFSPNDQM